MDTGRNRNTVKSVTQSVSSVTVVCQLTCCYRFDVTDLTGHATEWKTFNTITGVSGIYNHAGQGLHFVQTVDGLQMLDSLAI